MVEKLTTVVGSMFSGKTEELIRRITRLEIAEMNVHAFKPKVDDRYGATDEIRTHSGASHPATMVESSLEILEKLEGDEDVVAIDEAQFFDDDIVPVVQWLLKNNIEVIVAGLPLDFRGEPFGKMPELLALADNIEKLTAICNHKVEEGNVCGEPATKTQRFVDGEAANFKDPIVLVGGKKKDMPQDVQNIMWLLINPKE